MGLKILFICGSLEEGKDGVGDYVRRLSGELLRLGHFISAIAINDRHIQEEIDEVQDADGTLFPVHRLPEKQGLKVNFLKAKLYIKAFAPDIVSLQFVPYSFHIKGLPFGFASEIKRLSKGTKVHIMFHELWMDSPKGLKQKIAAIIQENLIVKLIKHIQPAKIHVSVTFNKQRLKNRKISAGILRLFGNVPGKEIEIPQINDADQTVPAVFYFGSAIAGELLEQIIIGLTNYCNQNPAGVKVMVASGTSVAKDLFINALRTKLSKFNISVVDCGFLSLEEVSVLMINSTVGISKISPHLLGKSGSSIAMLEYGLPLWMPLWDGHEDLELGFRENLIYADLSEAMQHKRVDKYKSLLPTVAAQFVQDLIDIK